MIGFPKHLNSRQDVENLLKMPEYASQVREVLRQCVAARFVWVDIGEVAADKPGVSDDTHRVVINEGKKGEAKRQLAKLEDPQAMLFRLGLTLTEAEAMISEAADD